MTPGEQKERLLEVILPPPIPTAITAVEALDRADIRVTVPAVKAKLVQLRGFDASTKEVSEAIADYRDFMQGLAEVAFRGGTRGLDEVAGLESAVRSRMLRDMVARMWQQANAQKGKA